MDGRVVSEAFEKQQEIETIASWDEIQGNDGSHPRDQKLDAFETEQALQQLVDLGYIEDISGDKKDVVKRCVRELNYNLARAYMDASRFADALPLLKDLYQEYSEEYRIGLQLAMCYKSMNRLDDLESLIESLAETSYPIGPQSPQRFG